MQLNFIRRSVLAAGLALVATGAPAQDYPSKPITLMVGLAAGGITDVTARLYAEAVSKSIGQRVTVENKTGAGGGVAAAAVQNAAPDGYTLLVFSGSQHATVPAVSNANYDPVKGFSPITYLFNAVVVLTVPADSPVKTMAELHELGRKKPGGLSVGTPGLGSPSHLLGAKIFLADKVPVEMVHYRGGAPMMADLITGRLDVAWPTLSTSRAYLADGKLRALALDADTRWGPLPDAPTLVELGFANERVASWFALGGTRRHAAGAGRQDPRHLHPGVEGPRAAKAVERERHADRQQHARGDGPRHGGGMGHHAGAGEDAEPASAVTPGLLYRSPASGIIGATAGRNSAMTLVRRFVMAVMLAGLATSAFSTAAFSAYPDRPIRWILSHPPGGSADVIARLMQPKLEKILGQPLIIENRAGAGGIIAMDALSKSKPDGYTIGMGASGSLATSPALGETVPYDPLKSFAPIAGVSGQPFMLAVPGDSPIKTLREVIDTEKRGNSKLTIGHGGAIMHLTAALFNYATGLKITLVTYKGTGPVVTDLLGAHIPLGIIDIPSAEAALASGKVRALAISSSQRFEGLPDVPTFQEEGLKDFEVDRLPRHAGAGRRAARRSDDDQPRVRHRAARSGGAGAVQVVRQQADDDRSKGVRRFHRQRDQEMDGGG